MLPKFKAGDRVKVINSISPDGEELFPAGTIGTVTEVNPGNKCPYKVEASDYYYFSGDQLALIERQLVAGTGKARRRLIKRIKKLTVELAYIRDRIEALNLALYGGESVESTSEREDRLNDSWREFCKTARHESE